ELNIYIGQYAQDNLYEKTIELMDYTEGRVLKRNYTYLAETIRVSGIKRPDSTAWARWLIKRDGMLIKNQMTNLLRFAESEQLLSIDYMQKLLQTLLEACSIACYEQGRNSSELFQEEEEYVRILKSYTSIPEMINSVDFCLRQYEKVICGKEEVDDLHSAYERIREIPRYLNENMDRMVSRKEASKYIFLSEDYFSRIFRKEYGMGYKEYMIKQKMQYAKGLLESTDLSVTMIASKVGYQSYANFIQTFRRLEEMTPKEYRKKYRKEEGIAGNKSQN
ncbi:MAG: AraC family transcriptional regulator, partial [Ruminococcus flavefaciens]|nr:AraC family transcriptional regulator [Ruminococcus flavefaciens]